MVRTLQSQTSSIITRQQSNVSMVSSTYGTENFKYNEVKAEEFFNTDGGGEGEMQSHYTGKTKHGGVGGKASKSHNFKECKNANIRRN